MKFVLLSLLLVAAYAAESEFEPAIEFCGTPEAPFVCQAFDASNNNGGAGCPGANLIRVTGTADYVVDPEDASISLPNPARLAFNARQISNEVHRVPGSGDPENARALTDWVTIFGQFLDHDLALTPMLEELFGDEMELEAVEACRPSVFCGDGICGDDETDMDCPADCTCTTSGAGGSFLVNCGDGMCDEMTCPNAECSCVRDCASDAAANFLNIPVLAGDPIFDPSFTGTFTLLMRRSIFDVATRTPTNTLQQVNLVTAFIDGSTVYGSDALRGSLLRAFKGGRLRTSENEFGEFMPLNGQGGVFLENDNQARADEATSLFVGGDLRVNEQPTLMGIHTLWVREHNWQADRLASFLPENTGDEVIFQMARRITIAEIQKIAYEDWLPALAGPNPLVNYRGFNSTVDPQVSNEFQNGVYRLGHTLINPFIPRINSDGSPNGAGSVALGENFFRPESLLVADSTGEGGLDVVWRGMATQRARELDVHVTDALRNMLFGPPLNENPQDLVTLNIQRARDHGIPTYQATRVALGLGARCQFSDISNDPETALDLFTAYDGQLDFIDLWPGVLAEDQIRGSLGETAFTVVADQFTRSRDGDEFFYLADGVLNNSQRLNVAQTTLSDIILRNSGIGCLPENVFFDTNFDFATCTCN